jgi:hypothetical protein
MFIRVFPVTWNLLELLYRYRKISFGGDEMQLEKYFHKCGYPILEVKRPTGLVVETFFLDGNSPFLLGKDGKQNPNLIKRCPECGGFIAVEKLFSEEPPKIEEKKRPTGYMPARI